MDTLGLKNYRVIKMIGQGGMGVVYCAEDMRLGRLVALKFLTPYLVREPQIVKRFRAEARSQACLVHPNITLVYAFEEEKDQAFLVLEYVDGETLEDKIKSQGRLSPQETAGIFHHILTAMDYAHSKGLVHRDLKPGNIGFTQEGVVKVMDFGIALNTQEANRLTRTGHILGTPHYMAPEQILGRTVDARTDIYALGITLFETLTGRVPFEGDSDYEVSVAQINDPPPSPRDLGFTDVSPALEEVLFKALAKKPEERFASCGEFLQALEDSLRPEVPAAALGKPDSPGSTEILAAQAKARPKSGTPPGIEAAAALQAKKGRLGGWPRLLLLMIGPLTLVAFLIIYFGPKLSGGLGHHKSTPPKISQKSTSPQEKPKPVQMAASSARNKPAPHPKVSNSQEKSGAPAANLQASLPVAHPDKIDKEAPGVIASLPQPPQQPAIFPPKEPSPEDVVRRIEKKLKEHGFSHLKVSLDRHGKIIVSGRVKSVDQKKEIIKLAKSASSSAPLDFGRLTVYEKVSSRPVRKTRPLARQPAPVVPELPRKPLPPKLD
jgi:serine/threonine protein kinase